MLSRKLLHTYLVRLLDISRTNQHVDSQLADKL